MGVVEPHYTRSCEDQKPFKISRGFTARSMIRFRSLL
jgi:hypothetical protein